jgi:hypothetical protein
MKYLGIVVSGLLVYTILCFGQASSSSAAPNAIGHGSFPAKVTKTLDSSKLKEGDIVEVVTAGAFKLPNGVLVPKESPIKGHVVAAKARSKGDADSQLTLAFDTLSISNGKSLSLNGVIQALFPPQEDAAPMMAGKATNAGGGSSLGGGDVGTVTNATVGSNPESASQPESAMNPKSVGVQGLHGLELNVGVVTSKGRNVKLSSGVRMILRVDILR